MLHMEAESDLLCLVRPRILEFGTYVGYTPLAKCSTSFTTRLRGIECGHAMMEYLNALSSCTRVFFLVKRM
jgi:hypothetical protein